MKHTLEDTETMQLLNEEITNEDRVAFANVAVDAYHLRTRHELGPDVNDVDEWHEVMGDLLCDLRHLADARGIEFDACMDRAFRHYMAEVEVPDPPATFVLRYTGPTRNGDIPAGERFIRDVSLGVENGRGSERIHTTTDVDEALQMTAEEADDYVTRVRKYFDKTLVPFFERVPAATLEVEPSRPDPVGCPDCGQLYGPAAIGSRCTVTTGCEGTIVRTNKGKVKASAEAALDRRAV